MARSFYALQHFAADPKKISLLPFQFTRLHGQELLVNEAGEFLFAPEGYPSEQQHLLYDAVWC